MKDEFGFESLEVWHKAIELANFAYKLTSAFPSDERFGLVSQMRRASVSVSANIAEGSSRWSHTEQARFYEIAYGSMMELVSEAKIAEQQGFLSSEKYSELRMKASEIGRMLSSLRHTTLQRT